MSRKKKPRKPLPPACRACNFTGLYYDEDGKPDPGMRHCSCPRGIWRAQQFKRRLYLTEAR